MLVQEIENYHDGHDLSETGYLPLLGLLLGIHYLAGVDVHHHPAARRQIRRRIVEVKVFCHDLEIVLVRLVVVRVEHVHFV